MDGQERRRSAGHVHGPEGCLRESRHRDCTTGLPPTASEPTFFHPQVDEATETAADGTAEEGAADPAATEGS